MQNVVVELQECVWRCDELLQHLDSAEVGRGIQIYSDNMRDRPCDRHRIEATTLLYMDIKRTEKTQKAMSRTSETEL